MLEIIPNYHPIFVHFTIALITISVITFILALLCPNNGVVQKECFIVSRWCLWLGALSTIPTLIAGFHAYYTVSHNSISHHVMTIHRNWALTTSTIIWIVAFLSWKKWLTKENKAIYMLGAVISLCLIAITGWYGSELVYRYGIGVLASPKPGTLNSKQSPQEKVTTSGHEGHEH